MTGRRKQSRIRRRRWLHRSHHHPGDQSAGASDTVGADRRPTDVEPDAPASLDQVLRHAAEARRPEPDQPD